MLVRSDLFRRTWIQIRRNQGRSEMELYYWDAARFMWGIGCGGDPSVLLAVAEEPEVCVFVTVKSLVSRL